MGKISLTVFLCTGKDCARTWRKLAAASPKKWLKHHLKEAGLPLKLHIIETVCMDRCEKAANLCFVHADCAGCVGRVRSAEDADRVLAAMRSYVERSTQASKQATGPCH
jgi:predicted metal-binding protein